MALHKRLFGVLKRNGADEEALQRFTVFLMLCCGGIPIFVFFGMYNFIQGRVDLAIIIGVLVASLMLGSLYQLHRPDNMSTYRWYAAVFGILLLYGFMVGGEAGSMALWLCTYPLVVIFVIGGREGIAWSIILIVLVMLLYGISSDGGMYNYSVLYLVRLLAIYLIVTFLSGWFEHFRNSYYLEAMTGKERFQEIMENSRDILYRRAVGSHSYDYISSSFYALLGYGRAQGSTWGYGGVETLIHPDDKLRHDEFIQLVESGKLSHGDEQVIEYRMRHREGHYLWFRDKVALIRDSDGHPSHVIGNNREITSLKQTQVALEQSRDQLFAIFNSIDAHIYAADMESYEILFMNNKMESDYGENLEGTICWRGFRNSDGPCSHCTNSKLLDTRLRSTGLHEWECYNPVLKRWYNNYDRAIRWIDGRWVRLQIAVDITRLKEMESLRQKNEEAQRRAAHLEAIGNLAGGVAHDFNNLLQIIMGCIDLVMDDETLSSEGREYLHEMEQATEKTMELANQLVTFSGGGNPRWEYVDVTFLIAQVVELVIRRKEITCELHSQDSVPAVEVDSSQMRLAFINLLVNACESMPDGGEIRIEVENIGPEDRERIIHVLDEKMDYIRVKIVDNGNGIEEDVLARVFDPYYSTKPKGMQKGMGLGLSIVYSIIHRHGGGIYLESERNKGTTVHVILRVDGNIGEAGPHEEDPA